jgi:hypothetical protein
MGSPKDDSRFEGIDEWQPEEVKPPSNANSAIIENASEIQRVISQHVPHDSAEDWGNFEPSIPEFAAQNIETLRKLKASLSKVAARPEVGGDSSDTGRRTILPVHRENVTPKEEVGYLRPEIGERVEGIEGRALEPVDDYNEDSIQIVQVDLDPRFDWRLAEEWASKYRRNPKFIFRGILACRECGVSPTWFLSRYLERNQDTPRREDVEEAHRRLLAEDQVKRQ